MSVTTYFLQKKEDSTENEINLPNEQDSGFMDPTETNNNNEVVAQSSESYLNEAEKKVEDVLISSLNRFYVFFSYHSFSYFYYVPRNSLVVEQENKKSYLPNFTNY